MSEQQTCIIPVLECGVCGEPGHVFSPYYDGWLCQMHSGFHTKAEDYFRHHPSEPYRPMHQRFDHVSEPFQVGHPLHDFFEWTLKLLEEDGYCLCRRIYDQDSDPIRYWVQEPPSDRKLDIIVRRWFSIDEKRFWQEKEEMLDVLRHAASHGRKP